MSAGEFNHCRAVIDVLQNAHNDAPHALCDFMRDQAKMYAPKETGNLSLRIETKQTGDGEWEVVSDTFSGGVQRPFSTDRHYAFYVEYGSANNVLGPNAARPRPYMTPAAAEGISKAQEIVAQLAAKCEDAAMTGHA